MKLHRKGELKMQKEKGIAYYRIHHFKSWFYSENKRQSSIWSKKNKMAEDEKVANIGRVNWTLKHGKRTEILNIRKMSLLRWRTTWFKLDHLILFLIVLFVSSYHLLLGLITTRTSGRKCCLSTRWFSIFQSPTDLSVTEYRGLQSVGLQKCNEDCFSL